MGFASIHWGYTMINGYDFNSSNEKIDLSDDISIEAYKTFQSKYPDLCNAIFNESSANTLSLKIPFSGYLGTNSHRDDELILRSFFDNNDAPLTSFQEQMKFEVFKPIGLSRDSIQKDAYFLFSQIIKNVKGNDDDFGSLELGFDDLRGFIVTDGESEWEVSITISEEGGQWPK